MNSQIVIVIVPTLLGSAVLLWLGFVAMRWLRVLWGKMVGDPPPKK